VNRYNGAGSRAGRKLFRLLVAKISCNIPR
jgi:hypothetical protein